MIFDDDVRSLKQQSVKRDVTPLWYIIPIPSQQVYPQSREATNTNFIVIANTTLLLLLYWLLYVDKIYWELLQ
jgi:hypothetical protein